MPNAKPVRQPTPGIAATTSATAPHTAANAQQTAIDGFTGALRQHFPSRDALLDEARAMTARQTQRRQQVKKTAGTLLGIAALGGVIWLDPCLGSQELRTAPGEQSRIVMTDGSAITLNTNSALTLERRLRTRSVVLRQGEASFTVARGWQPFVVQSGGARVRDISTAFTVRRLDDGSRITVLEGMVEISHASHAPPHEKITLRAGQSLQTRDLANAPGSSDTRTTGHHAYPIETVDTAVAGAWRQGRIIFDGTPLTEVAAEIQRYRQGAIRLKGVDTAQLRLSGVYDIHRIEALLDALPQALPVQIDRGEDDSVTIRTRR